MNRIEQDATGGEHDAITGVIELSTTDGFTGRGAVHFTGVNAPDETFEIDVEIQSQTASDGSGQRLVAHGEAVNVRTDTTTFVQFEKFSRW